MARTPRKNSEAPAVDAAAVSPVIPVESEEQSGTAREAPSTVSERQPAEPVVGATGADVGVQPAAHMTEGAETSSAPDLSNQDQSGSVVVGELGAEVLADRAASYVAGLSTEERDALSAALFKDRYAIGETIAVSEPIHPFNARRRRNPTGSESLRRAEGSRRCRWRLARRLIVSRDRAAR